MASYNTPKRLFNFASTPPTEGLVAAYNLDNVNDSFSTNHLTNNGGVTFVSGKIGNCASFDGVNDNLSINDNAALSIGVGQKISISGWFKLNAYPAVAATLVGKWNDNVSDEYLINVNAAGDLHFFVSSTGLDADIAVVTIAPVLIGVWYFFAAWYDGNRLGIALNAEPAIVNNYSGDIFNGTAKFRLGARHNDTEFLNGFLDSVMIFKHSNRVITTTERAVLYNNGIGREFTAQTKVLADEVNKEFNQLINFFNGIIVDITPKMSVDLAEPALTVNQNGAGAILQCLSSNVLKAEINNQGQLKSYVATGTAPIIMSSAATTRIDNLNVDLLDDIDSTAILQSTSYLELHNSVVYWSTNGITTAYTTLDGDTIIGIKVNVEFPGSSNWLSRFDVFDSGNHLLFSTDFNGSGLVAVAAINNIPVTANLYKIEFVPLFGTTTPDNITVTIITKKLAVAN